MVSPYRFRKQQGRGPKWNKFKALVRKYGPNIAKKVVGLIPGFVRSGNKKKYLIDQGLKLGEDIVFDKVGSGRKKKRGRKGTKKQRRYCVKYTYKKI